MAKVEVRDLSKKFGNTLAVNDVTLEFPDGKLTVLVGPSGCGKTTLLRILAGLEEPASGAVLVGNKDVTLVPAWDRNVAMVFQSYALYPHMTVYGNMAFPLQARGMAKSEIKRRVEETAGTLGLEDLLHRRPRELSGGQMQRVAIGRAIVRKPEVFLMDEPLSNLDAKLRVTMRAELKRLQRTLGVTTIYVTHDQAEAMTLADQLVVMNGGCVLQVGHPEHVYSLPDAVFVAGFIGSPGMNFIPCTLSDDRSCISTPGFSYQLPPDVSAQLAEQHAGGEMLLGIRPEDIEVRQSAGSDTISASVYISEALGKETLLTLNCGDNLLKACAEAGLHLDIGSETWLRFPGQAIRVFDAKNERRVAAGTTGVATRLQKVANG
jgi:multiple sugar transport system ATP-binding protein